MNLKPSSINPAVTHRVQPMGFVKVAVISSLFVTGAIALAHTAKPTEYKPQLTIPNTTPSSYAIQALKVDSKNKTGTATIKLDEYILKVSFDFDTHPDSYGVPGSEFTAVEITNLAVDDVKTIFGKEFGDFTDYNDHRNINLLLSGFIEKNKLVEAV